MRSHKQWMMGLLPTMLCLVAMLVAACGGSPTSNITKTAHAPTSQQIYRYWLPGPDIATYDPALVQDLYSIDAIQPVFTGLVTLDDNLKVVGQMATSWDKSADGLTWTFRMRSGLMFSDGTSLNANDVAYSIDRALQKDTQSPSALTYLGLIKDSDKLSAGTIKTIIGDSLIVQDANTLVIKLAKPGAYFLYAMTYPTSFPVEKRLIDKYGTKWTDHLTEGGGNGPFKVSVYSHTKGITLVPNSNYYGAKPQLQQLQFPFYATTDTAYQAFQANQLDYTEVPSAHYLADKTLSDFHKVHQLSISYFAMNYLTKPFDDIKIRQAFELALDKDVIVQDVLKGYDTPTNHIVPDGQPGYNPNLTGPNGATTHGNTAMAKQLFQQGLAEEGWTNASQMPTVKVTYPSTSQDAKNTVSVMIQRWQTVLGVTAVPNPEEFTKLVDDINAATNNAKGIQMWRIGWGADYPDPQDWTTLQFDNGSPNNNSNYGQNQSTDATKQVQVQKQLEAADVIQDPTTRYQAYNSIEQQLVNDVAWMPLWQVDENYRIKPYMVGVVVNSLLETPPEDWGNVYVAAH